MSAKSSKRLFVNALTFSRVPLIFTYLGFAIAGKDMVAHAAECEITDKNTAAVYSPVVAEPFAVWYAWAENPRYCELKAADGTSVSPFRMALEGVLPQGKNLID